MTTYEDLKKHCESVPVNHMGMRIACVQADTILELIARVEAIEANRCHHEWENFGMPGAPYYVCRFCDEETTELPK